MATSSVQLMAARRALSPLLAVIIGLIVTIVAGIILAQLYLSYAEIVASRPAVIVEYTDLVENRESDILVINLKNSGNVPVAGVQIETGANVLCEVRYSESTVSSENAAPPGSSISVLCRGPISEGAGSVTVVRLLVAFSDGSTQSIAVPVRARVA